MKSVAGYAVVVSTVAVGVTVGDAVAVPVCDGMLVGVAVRVFVLVTVGGMVPVLVAPACGFVGGVGAGGVPPPPAPRAARLLDQPRLGLSAYIEVLPAQDRREIAGHTAANADHLDAMRVPAVSATRCGEGAVPH